MSRNIWRRGSVMALALLIAAAAFHVVPVDAARKKILHLAHKEPETLDPHASILGQTQSSVRFMYRGLAKFAIVDGKVITSEVQPDLAESWTTSEDGLVWTFKLRQGVQFHHDFGEFTAEDVKFSFERQMSREKGMRFAQNLEVIKEIKVVDPYTVEITLKQFDPVFPLRMAGYQQGYIVSKKAVEQYGDDFGWNPVGTGPFYFHRHRPREKVIFRAFDDYYGGRPEIDEIHWYDVAEDATKLIGLEKGTFDIIKPNTVTSDFEQQVKNMGATLDIRGPGSQYRLMFNYTKPPFDDIKVRQAFMHAIDRQAIKDTLYPGSLATISTSPLPPGYFGHKPVEIPDYDPEKAKSLLKEAGYGPDKPLVISNYFVTKSFAYPKIMVLVQEQLKKVGVDLQIQLVEHPTYHANIRKNLNPFVLYGATRLTDGDVWLSLFFHSDEAPDPKTGNQGTNFAHYSGIDGLIEKARGIRDSDEREKVYFEAQEQLMKDAVVLPLVEVPDFTARNAKRVSSPFDPNYGEYALHYMYNYPEMLKIIE